jgi:hypothetical protein
VCGLLPREGKERWRLPDEAGSRFGRLIGLVEVAEGVCGDRTATCGTDMAGVDWDDMDWNGLACL